MVLFSWLLGGSKSKSTPTNELGGKVFFDSNENGLDDALDGYEITSDNLLVNGSFEANSVENDNLAFFQDSDVPGWRSKSGTKFEIWDSGRDGVESTDGSNHLELDADKSLDAIYQDIQTNAGQTYLLTFDMRSRGSHFNSNDEAVVVEWNGVKTKVDGYRATSAGEWTTITVEVTGTGGLDRLQLRESTSSGANDSTGPFLDNVQLRTAKALDSGVSDITVTLQGAGQDGQFGTGDDITQTQVTDANGEYHFSGLNNGDYQVFFSDIPDGRTFTTPDVGNDPTIDSDVTDFATGGTDIIPLNGIPLKDVDAGLIKANQTPNASDDSATTPFDTPITIDVLGNDVDPDGDPLSVTSINGQTVAPGDTVTVADGTVTVLGNGELSFTPDAGFTGDATFEYHANDGNGGEDTANVTVTVAAPVNNEPNAADDSATTPFGTPVTIDVLGNDVDPDGDPLSVTSINGQTVAPGDTVTVADGTVTVLGNGELSFTPDAGFTGDATFEYHANDGNGGEDTATVTVTVEEELATARVGNRVFLDANGDGIQSRGEVGVEGVTVTLTGAGDDGVIGTADDTTETTVTRSTGTYGFNNLAAGDYKVTFSDLPDGLEFTTANAGTRDTRDSDADETTGMTEVFTLAAGESNQTIDAGLVETFVNGDPNAADDSATTPLDTPITIDVLGNDIDPDGDPLSVTSINGQTVAPGDTVTVADGTVTVLGNGELSFTPDAGFTGDATFEYHANDGNGGEDTANVTVTVEAPINGDPNAADDSATTPFGTPVTIDVLGNDVDPDGDPLSVTSINGQTVAPGDTVTVADGTVTVLGNGELSFTPDAGFTGDASFEYHANDGNGGEDTATVTVTVEEELATARVGNRVFLDANGDGIQSRGEVGVEGVTVTLTGAGDDGVIGTADDTTETTVTRSNGTYGFSNLAASDYKVTFSDLPDGLEFTTANVGTRDGRDSDADETTGMTEVFTLTDGESNQTIDAGLVETSVNGAPNASDDSATTPLDTPITIDVLGNDVDPDGDPLSVTSINGQAVAPGDTVTVADGTVTVLGNGELSFTPDAGFTGDATFEYHANDGNGGEDTATVTVTVEEQLATARVGNRVFLDANGDGIQSRGEVGVEGVTVTLTGAGDDGVIGTADDTTETTVTRSTGTYGFNNLAAGDYKVTFSDLPDGLEFTTANVGTRDGRDSDADETTGMTEVFTLADGESNQTIDAGLVDATTEPKGSIGDTVFFDENGNGLMDAGESGVTGVTVTLTGAGEDGVIGTADDTTATDVTNDRGKYRFDNVTAGDYKVTFSDLPDGFEFTTANAGDDSFDSDANPANGMTEVFTLAAGESNNDIDAGLVASAPKPTGRIGNRVFLDANGDGIQNQGEVGVEGVTVTLTGAGTDGIIGTADDTTATTATNQNGHYLFRDVAADDYKVTFSGLPDGFTFTTANVGTRDGRDSDADPTTGMTEVFTLADGESNQTIDAGIIPADGLNLILGTPGNDDLLGTDGDDRLVGIDGIDLLTGGAGADEFVLGDGNGPLYADEGLWDFAKVMDFTIGEDTLVLAGGIGDYVIQDAGQNTLISGADLDVIAEVKNVSSTDLTNSNSLQFV